MNLASIAILALTFQAQSGTQTQSGNTVKTTPQTQGANQTPAKPTDKSVTYTSEELGLAFDHPKTWKKSTVKVKNSEKINLIDPKSWHPPRVDTTTRFLVPIPGVEERGILEIFSAAYFQDEDTWQTVQRDINEKMNRTVLRQWSEEVLGVPLLMTKIESKDKGVDLITETGLMYSASPRKLIFRLTASPDNFDKADYEWRQSLQTIKTTDGRLPSAEDPQRKFTAADSSNSSVHRTQWPAATPPTPAVVKGPVVTEATAGGKKVLLRTPAGWKVAKNADGSFTITSQMLDGSVKVLVASEMDSDPAGKALLRSSGMTLQAFSKVEKREEKGPMLNHGQANIAYIYRRGLAGAKPVYSFDAAGANDANYWVLTWSGGNAATASRDRKELETLVETMSIDPAP